MNSKQRSERKKERETKARWKKSYFERKYQLILFLCACRRSMKCALNMMCSFYIYRHEICVAILCPVFFSSHPLNLWLSFSLSQASFFLCISHSIVIYWKCDRYHVPIKIQNNQKFSKPNNGRDRWVNVSSIMMSYIVPLMLPPPTHAATTFVQWAVDARVYHFSDSNATKWLCRRRRRWAGKKAHQRVHRMHLGR